MKPIDSSRKSCDDCAGWGKKASGEHETEKCAPCEGTGKVTKREPQATSPAELKGTDLIAALLQIRAWGWTPHARDCCCNACHPEQWSGGQYIG